MTENASSNWRQRWAQKAGEAQAAAEPAAPLPAPESYSYEAPTWQAVDKEDDAESVDEQDDQQ